MIAAGKYHNETGYGIKNTAFKQVIFFSSFHIQSSQPQPNEIKPTFLSVTVDWRREFGCFSAANQGARCNRVGRHTQLTPAGREGCGQRLTDSPVGAARDAEALVRLSSCRAMIPAGDSTV